MVRTASLLGTQCVRLEFGSAARLSKRSGSVWNCLWRHTLKRSPGINRKNRVSYHGPGFLSSAKWPNGLNQTKPKNYELRHRLSNICQRAITGRHIIPRHMYITKKTRHIIPRHMYITKKTRHIIPRHMYITKKTRHIIPRHMYITKKTRHILLSSKLFILITCFTSIEYIKICTKMISSIYI